MSDISNDDAPVKGLRMKDSEQSHDIQRYRHVVVTAFFVLLVTFIAVFVRDDLLLSPLQKGRRSTDTPKYLDTTGKAFPWQSIRLPMSVRPLEYHVLIYPQIHRGEFDGIVEIRAVIEEQTSFIVLHGSGLEIVDTKVMVWDGSGLTSTVRQVKAISVSRKLQMYALEMEETLRRSNNVNITLKFEGKLEKKLSGLYLSNYTTPEGDVKYLATTQFEATGAREAFPCFDEPDMKAKFNLSIVRSRNYIALFNMPLQTSKEFKKDLFVDTFQQTVDMSTYLVAFVVCDYDSVTGITSQGTQVSVYAPSHQISQATFALETAIKVLNFYNRLFGINYPLPKQDLVAIPDFAAGAMENWGLITFRLTALLYDPERSTDTDKEYVIHAIAHELAHQWFGNLVTLKWWNDLWLNEGFATFVEYFGANEVDPTLLSMDRLVQNEMFRAMATDCIDNSHPITAEVSDPNEIGTLFDAISYSKGASLIRMLSNFIAEEKFWSGIKTYLNKYMYSNARTQDLWNMFKDFTQVDVPTLMSTWTKQMGYPVVTMTRQGDSVHVSQERFLLGRDGPKSSSSYKWYIPFRYAVGKTNGIADKLLIIHPDSEVNFPVDQNEVKWVKGNYGMYGYYRVNYEERNWRALIKQLIEEHTVFSAADRAGLLDDVFYLARDDKVSQTTALDMTKYLLNEEDYLPWSVAFSCLEFIRDRIRNKDVYGKIQKYTEKLTSPILTKLGWDDTGSHPEKSLRAAAISFGLVFGHPATIKKGKKNFDIWMQTGKIVNINLKAEIYQSGAQYGGEVESNFLLKKYMEAHVPSEKSALLMALCYTSQTQVIKRLLESAAEDKVIRHQDLSTVIGQLSSNPKGQQLVWQFVKKHWDNIVKWFSSSMFLLPQIIRSSTSFFSTKEQYIEVQNFFASVDTVGCERDIKASLERIQMNINWLKVNEHIVNGWFGSSDNILPNRV
ncbi:endoplasmic reticulum aminopeptidase 2-like [Argopecten irradians]|uniref:endoplasmic reticulum aminopeptidase 2-like n=1 Tax=Argopecten irradians TaxID=31199 RepID=UPI0037151CD1